MKTEPVTGRPLGYNAELEHSRLEMLNLLWVIKRGLRRPGDEPATQPGVPMSQLRKDRKYLEAALKEASESPIEEVQNAAARIRELMAQGVGLDPSTGSDSDPITRPRLPVVPMTVNPPPPNRSPVFRLLPVLAVLSILVGGIAVGWKWSEWVGAVRTSSPTAAPPPAPAKVVLRIHGSNTLGAELLPALAEDFLKKEGASTVRRVETAPNEWRIEATTARSVEPIAIQIKAHGSSTAFTDIGGGAADIGAASRSIKKEEAQALSRFGDLTSPAFEHVIGLDGLAVIVNKSNTIHALTKTQVARIFAGKLTDWADVGGAAGPIRVYARDDKSGTFDTFQHVVMGKDTLTEKAVRLESSDELSDKVAADTFGIGFIGLPYIRNAQVVAVADGESLPILPTPFTVATEDYPLARRLYLYTPPNPQNAYIRDFTEFALSDSGQQWVNAKGFVSQTVVATKPSIRRSFPSKYVELIRNAQRLSLSFRFLPEASALDNKAKRDLDRVMSFLARHPGRQVILLGFTDDNGNPTQKLEMSKAWAREVEQELTARGIFPVVVEGFGPAIPVANNGSPQGAQKNRRVEIWVM